MTFQERLGRVIELALPKLGPDAREQIAQLLKPASLEIVAAALTVWIAGHLVGVGEAVDIVLGVVGFFSLGFAVFSGIDELVLFARRTWSGSTDADFEDAAAHLANAVAILGVQAVLALLFKERPTPGRRVYGPEPARTPGLRYKPATKIDPSMGEGAGGTTFWGDVRVSPHGSEEDQKLALLHEKVHQFLAPKFYVLRRFRVENRYASYFQSSLIRYVEEALAETIAQVGVNGLSGAVAGLKFPVENRYVYLLRTGGYAAGMKGAGVVPEAASLLGTGAAGAFAFELWLGEGENRPADGHDAGSTKPVPLMMP